MKITFKNFKQHADRTFELPDTGLVNISGRSGAGKTTLLRGFQFALFDGVKKPYTHGTKTCEVELSLPGLEISRQKGPGRLIVNGQEDATAQDIIEKTLGMTEAEFMASSYIQQKMQSSLLTLSPSEQLAFIERLAFGENSPDKIKAAINAEVLAKKKDIDSVTQKAEMIDKMIADQKAAIEKLGEAAVVVPDINEADAAETKEVFESWTKIRSEAGAALTDLNNEKSSPYYKLVSQISSAKVEAAQAESQWKERLKEIDDEIASLGQPWTEQPKEQAEAQKSAFQDARNYLKLAKEIDDLNANLNAAKEKATKVRNEIDQQMASLPPPSSDSLADKKSALEALAEWIKLRDELGAKANGFASKYPDAWSGEVGAKKYLAISNYLHKKHEQTTNSLGAINTNVVSLREELLLLKQSLKTLTCPKCATKLSLINGSLTETAADVEGKIRATEEAIKNDTFESGEHTKLLPIIEMEIKLASEIYEQVRTFPKRPTVLSNQKLDTLEDVERELVVVDAKIAAESETEAKRKNLEYRLNYLAEDMLVKRYAEELEQKNKQIGEFAACSFTSFGEINKAEAELLYYINKNIGLETRIKNLELAKKTPPATYTRAVGHVAWLEKQMEGISVPREMDELDCEFEAQSARLAKATQKIEALTPFMEQIAEWEKLKNEAKVFAAKKSSIEDQIAQLQIKATDLEAEKNECLAKYQGTLDLKQASEACQMEAVAGVVDSINIAAKEFLDLLFPEDPCVVSLLPFKQNKSTEAIKAKFSTVIQYKGCEYSDIDEVSGGEYDRIVLAYQLALNSIYNSPILLLDEAFTAVEEELFLIAMDALRVVAKEKLILVISHGANQGVFDQVIEV